MMKTGLLALLMVAGCRESKSTKQEDPKTNPPPPNVDLAAGLNEKPGTVVEQPVPPALQKEREDFLADTTEFTHKTRDQVMAEINGGHSMRDDWANWEKQGPMTDARIKQFYKETSNYIYDLGAWHLWDPGKYQSDLQLVDVLKQKGVKTVLDFGGGVAFNSIPMARAGLDVTLADLDSTTLKFAQYRAEHHANVKLKFWKSDVEPAPPLPKYDAILCLDVLEHLPKQELHDVVDKLVKLKTPTTVVIIHAPFGKTATHPMHLDLTEDTKAQVARLQNELPPK
jgi:2-polyprenyl-3-methyl-5-hydroxy-6-metoxy-1,4-benzoquinol methylase